MLSNKLLQTIEGILTILHMKPIFGVDTNIFYAWVKRFVDNNLSFRANGSNFIFILDIYACHLYFTKLSLPRYNGIVVIGLSVHTPNVLQPLYLAIFGPLKEDFRLCLALCTIMTKKGDLNDIVV